MVHVNVYGLSSSLQQSAKTFTEQGSMPSGVLSVSGPKSGEAAKRIQVGGKSDMAASRTTTTSPSSPATHVDAGRVLPGRRSVTPAARAVGARGGPDLPRAGVG
jgi:hypothetical protein